MKKSPELKKLIEKLDNSLNQEQYIFELCVDGVAESRNAVAPNIIIVRFNIRSK